MRKSIYPTASRRIAILAAGGHFGKILDVGLFNKMLQLKRHHNEKKESDLRAREPHLTHLPGALLNVPSEDMRRLKTVTDGIRERMNDMFIHTEQFMQDYIKHSDSPDRWANNPVLIDYLTGPPANMSGLPRLSDISQNKPRPDTASSIKQRINIFRD